MKYECKENDCLIEIGRDKNEILISVQGEIGKTVIGLKDLNEALILFGVSQRSEPLVAFMNWYLKGDSKKHESIQELADRYIATNCG